MSFPKFTPGQQVAVMRRGAYTHLYSIDAPCFIVNRTKCGWKVRVETPKGTFFKVIAETNLKPITGSGVHAPQGQARREEEASSRA